MAVNNGQIKSIQKAMFKLGDWDDVSGDCDYFLHNKSYMLYRLKDSKLSTPAEPKYHNFFALIPDLPSDDEYYINMNTGNIIHCTSANVYVKRLESGFALVSEVINLIWFQYNSTKKQFIWNRSYIDQIDETNKEYTFEMIDCLGNAAYAYFGHEALGPNIRYQIELPDAEKLISCTYEGKLIGFNKSDLKVVA